MACSDVNGTDGGNISPSGSALAATSTQAATLTTSGVSTATTKAGRGSKTIVLEYGLSVVIFLTFGIGAVLC
jgi:hypothetical protein